VPAWAGKWKGGRYYLDAESGKPVYFIERRGRSVRLQTHDEDLAVGQLAAFLADPVAFTRPEPWGLTVEPATDLRIEPWTPDRAAYEFANHFRELFS
jgi:hypothetical protein